MSAVDRHREVAGLLPWYVNGTLAGRDFAVVAAHLAGCPACRDEVAQCQTLAAAFQSAPDAAWTPAAGRLERVLASIERLEADRRPTGWRAWSRAMESLRDLLQATPGPMRWALAAQAALLVLLVVLAAGPGVLARRAPYQTLADGGRAQPGQGQINIVFAEDITERELRTLLGRVQGKIVDGPSAIGVYTVAVQASTPDGLTPIVALLRTDPNVRFAEPAPKHRGAP